MSDPRTIDRTYFAAEGMTACVAIPLASHGRLVGVLALVARRPEDLGATEVEIAIESVIGLPLAFATVQNDPHIAPVPKSWRNSSYRSRRLRVTTKISMGFPLAQATSSPAP